MRQLCRRCPALDPATQEAGQRARPRLSGRRTYTLYHRVDHRKPFRPLRAPIAHAKYDCPEHRRSAACNLGRTYVQTFAGPQNLISACNTAPPRPAFRGQLLVREAPTPLPQPRGTPEARGARVTAPRPPAGSPAGASGRLGGGRKAARATTGRPPRRGYWSPTCWGPEGWLGQPGRTAAQQ